MMREEEDEETLFDQEGLLGSGKKSSWDWDWVRRFTKTLSLSLAFFALGLCVSIPGATLLDLGERTNSSTEHISLIFSARSVGYLLGSVVGGVLFDYFDQQILLFYTLVLTGIATVAIPWCTALFVLACMIAVQGMALGVLDTGGNMFCIKIWSKSSPPYMQTVHFSFAVGAFLAPLLARPFLLGDGALEANSTLYSVSHFPVITSIPDLSSGGGSGIHDNTHDLTASNDNWWLMDTGRGRVLRDIKIQMEGQQGVGLNSTVREFDLTADELNSTADVGPGSIAHVSNITGNVSTANITISTTSAPRAAKPAIADAKHLDTDFANGDKAKQHIMDHKDDQRSESPEEGATFPKPSSVESPVQQNENGSLSGSSVLSAMNNTSESSTNHTDSSDSQLEPVDETPSGSTITTKITTTPTPTPKPSTTTTTTTTTSTTTPTITTTTTIITTTTTTTTKAAAVVPETEKKDSVTNNSLTNISVSTVSPIPTSTTTRKPKPEILDMIYTTFDAVKNMSKIQFAYLIIGLILMGDAVFFLGLYCKDCKAGTLLHQVNALGPSPPSIPSCFRMSLLSLLFVFFLLYVGMEVAFGGLITTFAVKSMMIHWSQRQGATLAALFWGSIAVGRGMAIFIARCFKPPCMLVTNLVFLLAGAIVLSFALKATPIMLWVGTVIVGLGMSSIFPTAISWADCYYPLTGRAAAVFITGSGVGEMVIPVATGYLFEKWDSMWLMYIVMGLSILVTLVFVCLQCVASRQPPPTSMSKMGFLPLHNEEENSIAMDDLANGNTMGFTESLDDVANGSSGYTQSTRRRQMKNSHVQETEEETTRLVDISE